MWVECVVGVCDYTAVAGPLVVSVLVSRVLTPVCVVLLLGDLPNRMLTFVACAFRVFRGAT